MSYASQERSGLILAASDEARIDDVIIRNNICFNNPVASIKVVSGSRIVSVYNNPLDKTGVAGVLIYGTQTGAKHNIQNDRADVVHSTPLPGARQRQVP